MKRPLASVTALVALASTLLVAAGDPPAPAPSAPPDEPSLAELEALRREVRRAREDLDEDPFEGGPPPDLVVLSSTDVHGETAPCG